jgi:hypothetical protein
MHGMLTHSLHDAAESHPPIVRALRRRDADAAVKHMERGVGQVGERITAATVLNFSHRRFCNNFANTDANCYSNSYRNTDANSHAATNRAMPNMTPIVSFLISSPFSGIGDTPSILSIQRIGISAKWLTASRLFGGYAIRRLALTCATLHGYTGRERS